MKMPSSTTLQSKVGQLRSAKLAPSFARGEQRSPAASNLILGDVAPGLYVPFLIFLFLPRDPPVVKPRLGLQFHESAASACRRFSRNSRSLSFPHWSIAAP